MDVQLQELIDKIKKDGVTAAEKESAKIIAESEKKAEAIIADAQTKAAEIIKSAQAETKKMEQASEEAIIQAGRNMLLSFKDALSLFNDVRKPDLLLFVVFLIAKSYGLAISL